jgi:isopropylmalate/homocitrate/citramalate synthase
LKKGLIDLRNMDRTSWIGVLSCLALLFVWGWWNTKEAAKQAEERRERAAEADSLRETLAAAGLTPVSVDDRALATYLETEGELVRLGDGLALGRDAYERARDAGCTAIALFTAASDQFSQENVNATIDETFERFAVIVERARADGVWIRGYVSTATDCPYTGEVDPEVAVAVAERLFELGCDEVALADTIGRATPKRLGALLDLATARLPVDQLALHLHDTGGLALANVIIGLDYGVTVFDSSAGGLGGCPFAPGAPGNLATERLLTLLHGLGIETGVSATHVIEAIDQLRAAHPDLGCRDAA